MAKYKNGIHGPLSGKVGHVIASSWRGVNYLKSIGEVVAPPTKAQKRQRELFAMVSRWLKPIRPTIWVGFQVHKGPKTPMHGAISLLMLEAAHIGADGRPAIHYSKVIFSRGELLNSWVHLVEALPGNVLNFCWADGAESAFCRPSDQVTVILYNVEKACFSVHTGVAARAEGRLQLELRKDFRGDQLHVWLFYVGESGEGVSTSVYLGLHLLR